MPATITSSGGTPYTFISLKQCNPQTPAQVVEEITRPGVDGHGYRETGKRSEINEFLGVVDVDDSAAAVTRIIALKALQGTLVTILDDHGISTPNVMLRLVELLDRRKIITAVGGLSTLKGYLLRMRFAGQISIQT